jgi:hypothetical protein
MKRLTTKDNPYDPFTQFDKWNAFDTQNGYNTLSLLARLCVSNDEETEEQAEQDYAQAVDDVMKYANIGIYKVVTRTEPLPAY